MINMYSMYNVILILFVILALYGLMKFAFYRIQEDFKNIKRITEKSPLRY